MVALPSHGALPKGYLRLAPLDSCGGVKNRIFRPGVRWQARDKAQCESICNGVFLPLNDEDVQVDFKLESDFHQGEYDGVV